MQYTTMQFEVSRGIVREQEASGVHQRKKVLKAIAERDPADELQARLLIMEQSLISMTRFLKILERDLQTELSLQKYHSQKRIEDRRRAPRAETIAEATDRFAAQATDAAIALDEIGVLEAVARAMRMLGRP